MNDFVQTSSESQPRPDPNEQFYIRTHFEVPAIDVAQWKLKIDGQIERPFEIRRQLRGVSFQLAFLGHKILFPTDVRRNNWRFLPGEFLRLLEELPARAGEEAIKTAIAST